MMYQRILTVPYSAEDVLDWEIGASTLRGELEERAWASLRQDFLRLEGLKSEVEFVNGYYLVDFLAVTTPKEES